MDQSNLLEKLIALFHEQGIRFCVIGGQAVNAYVEPLVNLDLDLVIALDQLEQAEALLKPQFDLKRFAHYLNVALSGSNLRVRIQTDERYGPFVEAAILLTVLGLELAVATLENVLQGRFGPPLTLNAGGVNGKRTWRILPDYLKVILTCVSRFL